MNASSNKESSESGDWVIDTTSISLWQASCQRQCAPRIQVFLTRSNMKGGYGDDNA